MATEQQAGELRTQGVINAANDPDSNVTADDAEKAIVEESKNAGIPAFKFDPNASPEEKRAQARAVRAPRDKITHVHPDHDRFEPSAESIWHAG